MSKYSGLRPPYSLRLREETERALWLGFIASCMQGFGRTLVVVLLEIPVDPVQDFRMRLRRREQMRSRVPRPVRSGELAEPLDAIGEEG